MFSDADTNHLLDLAKPVPCWIVLRYKEGSSDKFYSLYQQGTTIEIGWGRYPKQGSVLRTTGSTEVCSRDFKTWDRLYSKLRKGYQLEQIQLLTGANDLGYSHTHYVQWSEPLCFLKSSEDAMFVMEITKSSFKKLLQDGVLATSDIEHTVC